MHWFDGSMGAETAKQILADLIAGGRITYGPTVVDDLCKASQTNPIEYYQTCMAMGVCSSAAVFRQVRRIELQPLPNKVSGEATDAGWRIAPLNFDSIKTGMLLGFVAVAPDGSAVYVPLTGPTAVATTETVTISGNLYMAQETNP